MWPRTIQFIKGYLEALIKVINMCAFRALSIVIFQIIYYSYIQRTNLSVSELCRRKGCFSLLILFFLFEMGGRGRERGGPKQILH